MKDLSDLKKYFTDYTEVKVQNNTQQFMVYVNGRGVKNEQKQTSGVGARVCKNGAYGFAAQSSIEDDAIKLVIKNAGENAAFLAAKKNTFKTSIKTNTIITQNNLIDNNKKASRKETMEYIKSVDEYIAKKYPDAVGRNIYFDYTETEKSLMTSDGSQSYSNIPKIALVLHMTVVKDNQPTSLFEFWGGCATFGEMFKDTSQHFCDIDRLHEEVLLKAEGEYAKPGIATCVLDSKITGVLAHEAIGHTVESDLVMNGSVAEGKIGKQIASPLISLTDFANTAFGERCIVPVYCDDEGTKAQDSAIITDGILTNYLHNKESAEYYGAQPMGNARGSDYFDEPLVRMRNTAILPGKSKVEDMIASIDDGYYLTSRTNGQADATGEFMFGVNMGYRIKNGKIGNAIKDFTISGMAFDVLKSVDMVSDTVGWSTTPCGKKQMIAVSMGGPAIKCRVNLGGK